MRRKFIFGGLLLALAGIIHAENIPQPYLKVKPVQSDENTVRVFFSPRCSYSKDYFQFFKNLSVTLPPETVFEYSPVVNRGDGVEYSLAFLAVRRFYPRYVPNFLQASFIGAQDRMISTSSWGGIDRLGKAAGVPVSIPRLVVDNQKVLSSDLVKLVRLQSQLEITNTPSVAVGGTYIATPEFVKGDAAMFSQLVNSIISMNSGR